MATDGEKRGVGRPKLAVTRKARTIKAFDEEWALIHTFARMVKENPKKAEQVLNYGVTLFKGFRAKAEELKK